MLTVTLEENIEVMPKSFKAEFELMDELYHSLKKNQLTEILCITTFPPRECGIATYSQDLVKALNSKFNNSFTLKICPIESHSKNHYYTDEITHTLNTDIPSSYINLAEEINTNDSIGMVLIQHEFGLFAEKEKDFEALLFAIEKPVIIVFHTVLPNPSVALKNQVQQIVGLVTSVIVMTHSSLITLQNDYDIDATKIHVIAHGTHLVQHLSKKVLKKKYHLTGRTILSTFGLLSSGKSIETTLNALPLAIEKNPNILFLIIGKTHPSVVSQEGEAYREMLEDIVEKLHLKHHVTFINYFLPLDTLLEYLQLTDVYLFTSKNPNQAVSGTFSYAVSCGCPIISTPNPQTKEVLKNDAGIIFDIDNSKQLSNAIIKLLGSDALRKKISSNGLHRMASTAWENAAIAHALLFKQNALGSIALNYTIPDINLHHIKKMTTDFGMIQFSKINHPDIESGYTLDDNARAMVAMCQHYKLTKDESDLKYIDIYLNFIKYCLQPNGYFLNYVDEQKNYTEQNNTTNLEDSNGRAIWALGYLISLNSLLPNEFHKEAKSLIKNAVKSITAIHSTRAMAFIIKGLYYANSNITSKQDIELIKEFADRLVQMYYHEQDEEWPWFESYLTYANSIVPEAMLCAWLATGKTAYKEIAKKTFDFLLSKTFNNSRIKVISNKTWLHKAATFVELEDGGEQPIDVAYTIMALSKFYNVFKEPTYLDKMEYSFNWFLGNNHLHQIIYNPCTGGCYDGLEENYVNLNQGAESTVSYLMARLTIQENNQSKSSNKQLHSEHQY
ncbi:MAG: glycosyltransferase [Bacteroidetes bacterium]|nr:glycosyltransferase [Bacteroidota bacterium]